MTLISDSEMAALRDVALSGMVTSVAIYNRTTVETPDGQETDYPATPSSTVQGWLYELTPYSNAVTVISGGEGMSEFFRLLLPVGTTIAVGDKAVIGSGTYYVQNTGEDNTYKPTLTVSLRRVL